MHDSSPVIAIDMSQVKLHGGLGDPYEGIIFVKRRSQIHDKEGKLIFDRDVEFPDYFDDNSISIVSSKYLCNDAKKEEKSFKQMIDRVSETIVEWGLKDGYFKSEEEAAQFLYYLKYYQVRGYFAFNSPVYFNVGLIDKPQCSACFILEIEDNMESIFDVGKLESLIFKWGSGSGMNMSALRSSRERVKGGGFASGPVSFLKAHDTIAGVIKSGGTLRRSAKLVCLDIDHPDVIDFMTCKEKEEKKLRILQENGIEPDRGYEMSDHVFYQNTNISIRIPDSFMEQVERNGDWQTKYVLNGAPCETFKAKDLLNRISEQVWRTGDPGVQFSDNTNNMNTCKVSGEIKSTNPCGEFAFLNNSSCNLAAMNLRKFFTRSNKTISFDSETFKQVIKICTISQDIIVQNSSYPNKKITNTANKFRPLGLGFSNLGSMLMWLGLPYDSEEGRNISALLMSIITGYAYIISNKVATKLGPFEKFDENKSSMYEVLNKHYIYHFNNLGPKCKNAISKHMNLTKQLQAEGDQIWDGIKEIVTNNGLFRNAQTTLLAPTGTTSFIMGCSTTGVEPEFSLIKFKTLSGNGGSTMKLINPEVQGALENLGYQEHEIKWLVDELYSRGHFEKSKLLPEHLPIFDTSNSCNGGVRCIDYMGHVKMVSALQPLISGAISKTINVPNNITVEEISNLYYESWKLGLKGITIYRDGSKEFQPLNSSKKEIKKTNMERTELPSDREAVIHKFEVSGVKGYITAGLKEDGGLAEIFVTIAKQGSSISGFIDSLAIVTSIALQYTDGAVLKDLVKKLSYQSFEPSGFTKNPEIGRATSLIDYIFRWLGLRFLPEEDLIELGLYKNNSKNKASEVHSNRPSVSSPPCKRCGSMMVRKGSCYSCTNCGDNDGACG